MNANPEPMPVADAVRPGLLRRLAAILYDALVVMGIAMFVTILVVVPLGMALGQDGWERLQQTAAFRVALQLLLVITIVGFHLWFWTHGGQSLGMRAWRLQVVRNDGLPLTFSDALLRYATAVVSALPVGLGFLWSLFDPEKLTWHDRWSKTRLLLIKRDR
jgi:uncharacterized RDD family membrane protein YckC